MNLVPEPWWLPIPLAAVLLFDAVASIRPFIRECSTGCASATVVDARAIKTAVAAVVNGFQVGLAANPVVAYFVCRRRAPQGALPRQSFG